LIEQGRVTVDGETITSPALDVAPDARITVDGERLPARERTRLFLYHKPAGLVTTARDPEGRTTVFERLPEDLPRVVTIGRLDINTEGLLLLTNDGGLARVLGHPETAWLRRYRVRAHGHVTQAQLDGVREGVTIDGENFGPVVATMDREQGDNTWLTVDLREGKNREVKRVLEHLGLIVNRLIRVSFGPFQLGELAEGEVEEVRTKVLRDQLGDQLAAIAGADFDSAIRGDNRLPPPREEERPRGRDFGDRPRPRFGDRDGAPRRFEDRGPPRAPRADDKPMRPRRDAKYRTAPDDEAERPRDVLLRAEAGKDAVWRDEETAGLRSGPRKPPRRGADPRAERASQAESGERERVRSAPIQDPAGRRVTVERVTGPAPEIKRKPRYTREDFAPRPARDEGERPPRPRFERDGESRPPRPRFERDGEGPRGPRKFGGGAPRDRDGERRGPPRDDGERRGPPRARAFDDKPGGRSGGGFGGGGHGGRPGGSRGGPRGSGPGGGGPRGDFKPRGPRKPRD
jgi:23S rRNA pseudouridine2605 synthase